MVNGKGVSRPYVNFLGNSATDVTGSMHLVRFQKYALLLDCGLVQGKGNIVADYKANREQLKKIKPKEIDYIILSHVHVDHSGMIPALFGKGCNAHVYVPTGSMPFLKLLWYDSLKIMQSDCLKIEKKHGLKAPPLFTESDIEKALNRCIEVDTEYDCQLNSSMMFRYYSAGHILYAQQVYLTLREGSVIKRIGYTGDISGLTPRPFVLQRRTMPFVNLMIGENTYNVKGRPNNVKDRVNDMHKIEAIVQNSNKILIPTFSLQRTQELISYLHLLNITCPIYLDSPLAQKFCELWPEWGEWWPEPYEQVKIIKAWEESQVLQQSNEHCIIIAASGFLTGGRIMAHLKTALPDFRNHLIFIGYAGENNLASQIKSGQNEVVVDGEAIRNNANITELRSFSSHASYEELMEYYGECGFDKLALVHGNYENKVGFSRTLQDKLVEQGKSSRVVCVNQDQKIYL